MSAKPFRNGIIHPSTRRGKMLGFTADKFDGYLWKDGDAITISYIRSKKIGKGYFVALVERILALGFTVKVPTPLPQMRRILEKNSYTQTFEHDSKLGQVEVWTLEPLKDKIYP